MSTIVRMENHHLSLPTKCLYSFLKCAKQFLVILNIDRIDDSHDAFCDDSGEGY